MNIIYKILLILILLGLLVYLVIYINNYKLSSVIRDNNVLSGKINDNKSLLRIEKYMSDKVLFNIKYYVINLPQSKDRLLNITNKLNCELVNYQVVEAVDSRTYYDKDYIDNWPCLIGHPGTKGVQLSNLKIFKYLDILPDNEVPEWIGIFEDDAKIPHNFNKIINYTLMKYPYVKVVNFDDRGKCNEGNYSGCCCSLMLYHKSLIKLLIKELDYKTSIHMNNSKKWNRSGENKCYRQGEILTSSCSCLWDWYIFDLLKTENIPMVGVPVVGSGDFDTTIT